MIDLTKDEGAFPDQRFSWKKSKDGATVTVYDNGRHVAAIPAKDFARDGEGMVEAWGKGQVYSPQVSHAGQLMSPAAAKESRLQLLERGTDATRSVSDWVRYLATIEAREDGVFGDSLDKVQAEQWPALVREIFDSLYTERPAVLETPGAGSGWIHELVTQAESQPEWSNLRDQVKGDPWSCGISAGQVAASLAEKAKTLLEAVPKEDPQRLAEDAQALEDALGVRHKATKRALKKAAAAAQQAEAASALAVGLGQVMGEAAAAAESELAEIQQGSTNMADLSSGALQSLKAAPEEMRKALASNPNLRKLVELAGRMRLRARAKQRAKTKYAPESIVDVTIGGELERLLPSELCQLMLPQTKLLLMAKLQERQALQYDLEGEERLDCGPVILAVDSSGSMQGIRNQWAMAVAIAVLEVAAMQRRAFVLMHFDDVVRATFTVEKPKNLKLSQLLEMVSYFSGNGTNFAPPLRDAHGIITNGKQKDGVFARADVMLITDGQASWGTWAADLKKTGAALYGVAIEEKFKPEMEKELTGCSYVSTAMMGNASANVDLLFGI